MYNKQFIYDYWNRTEVGQHIIAENILSEQELLFLMPNNVKRAHRLPPTRNPKEQRGKQAKIRWARNIINKLFFIFSKYCSEIVTKRLNYENFVDVKEIGVGET